MPRGSRKSGTKPSARTQGIVGCPLPKDRHVRSTQLLSETDLPSDWASPWCTSPAGPSTSSWVADSARDSEFGCFMRETPSKGTAGALNKWGLERGEVTVGLRTKKLVATGLRRQQAACHEASLAVSALANLTHGGLIRPLYVYIYIYISNNCAYTNTKS